MSEFFSSATISADQLYRYNLDRVWSSGNILGWIMLNPSTANATANDPTVRECMAHARRWKYSGITICNLFAYRTSSPAILKEAAKTQDIIGPENNDRILNMAQVCNTVVLAWGAKGNFRYRDKEVLKILTDNECKAKLMCLGITNNGMPLHPLGTIGPVKLEPYDWQKRIQFE